MNLFQFILLLGSLLSCYSDKTTLYTKYVYQLPKLGRPFEAVTETDIWFSRIRFRGLTKLNNENLLELDLASSIETKDYKTFQIKLKTGQKFSNDKVINLESVKKSLEMFRSEYRGDLAKNIEAISITSDSLIIKLIKRNTRFKNALASHVFGVFDTEDLKASSGLYKTTDKADEFLLTNQLGSYPSKIQIKVFNSNEKLVKDNYDTALLPAGILNSNRKQLEYSVFETWGLIVDLKNPRLSNKRERNCLNLKLDRAKLVSFAFRGHKASSHLDKNVMIEESCELTSQYKVLVPTEIEKMAHDFCLWLKDENNLNCELVDFKTLLTRIKKPGFDLALLSLTLDLPYIESFSEYLNPKNSFSILNKEVDLPKTLNSKSGSEYLSMLSDFLYREAYFIALSKPKRKIWGSKIDAYKPSLIAASYDSLENLKR